MKKEEIEQTHEELRDAADKLFKAGMHVVRTEDHEGSDVHADAFRTALQEYRSVRWPELFGQVKPKFDWTMPFEREIGVARIVPGSSFPEDGFMVELFADVKKLVPPEYMKYVSWSISPDYTHHGFYYLRWSYRPPQARSRTDYWDHYDSTGWKTRW